MDRINSSLTIYFENPFWVGLFERMEGPKLSVCKVTFGAEPKDCEIQAFILKNYDTLQFSPAVETDVSEAKRKNPKRMQREVTRQMQNLSISTKSQQALKLQQEQKKQERRLKKREQKDIEAKRMFERKQQKKLEKHKGH